MRILILHVAVCVVAALVPWMVDGSRIAPDVVSFPGWPIPFGSRSVAPVPLTDVEKRFERSFPGRMAKFSDGERVILMRRVNNATRKLHPAADCYKGSGYTIRPLPLWVDSDGITWGCMEAKRGSEVFKVYERVFDDSGQAWTDISAWYWAAVLGKTNGPWWAVTVAQRQQLK